MCGIVGMATRAPAFNPELAAAMRDTLVHRGPDDAGLWSSDDGRLWLAQRRLAIIDLSPAGHQPMVDSNGRHRITFNGEIYNYRELKQELEAHGHVFRTKSDTEVLLVAYRQWGAGCVDKLNGMFAFAIFDEDKRQLFLARDRAGEKPLYYWHEPGRFAFASELKALLAHPACPRRVDREALDHYLTFGYVPGALCLLAGLRKLPPASTAIYDLAGESLRVGSYGALPRLDSAGDVGDERLVDELAQLLEDSVRLRLHADVPVGVMLSGGIDSSLVAAMAARAHDRVKTFTIAFPGQGVYDESKHARRVADALGTEHVELAAEPAHTDVLPLLAAQYDEPMADSSMIPTYLVSKLIREHATVALGGDGGDELFGGYQHYPWIGKHTRMRRLVPRTLRHLTAFAADRVLPIGMRGRTYALALAGTTADAISHVNLYFDRRLRERLLAPLGAPARTRKAERFRAALCDPTRSELQQATMADFLSYLPDDILVKVDRASMLSSLEVRAAFLDPRLIDFAFGRVPDRLKVAGGEQKVILRRLAARLLPREIVERGKRGFSIPMKKWFAGDWGRFIVDAIERGGGDVFDRQTVREMIDGQKRGMNNEQRLFALALFELWRAHYRISV